MPLVVTITKVQPAFNTFRVQGTIVASGNYPTAGDTLNFLTATYPVGQGPLPVNSVPQVDILSQKPAASPQTNEFQYGFAPGTDSSNGKMQVFTGAAAQTALTELSAGAYPAGVTGDAITFEAVFNR